MSIRSKISLSFLSVALIFGLFGAYVFFRNLGVDRNLTKFDVSVKRMLLRDVPQVLETGRLIQSLKEMDLALYHVKAGREGERERYETGRKMFAFSLDTQLTREKLKGTESEGGREHDDGTIKTGAALDELRRRFDELDATGEETLRMIGAQEAGAMAGLDKFSLQAEGMMTVLGTLERTGATAMQTNESYIRPAAGELLAGSRQVKLLALFATLGGVGLALAVGWLTSRRIAGPLAELKAAAQRIGDGDLSARVDIRGNDEIAVLGEVLNNMAGHLSETFGELEQTLGNLNSIMSNMVDGLLVTDLEGIITLHNPAVRTMFSLGGVSLVGQSCDDIFGREMFVLVHQARKQPAENFVAEVELARGKIGKAIATGIVRDPDLSKYAPIRAQIGSANAGCLGVVMLIRDITAEKEVDRMKTDFISTVSHELRTPLTSVIGFARVIQKRLHETIFPALVVAEGDKKTKRIVKQVGEDVGIIVSEGERLTNLINDVLDIAKIESGKMEWKMEEVPLEEIVERGLAATKALFDQKSLGVVRDFPENLPPVCVDRDRIIQVVINLISNAVKFTDSGDISCRLARAMLTDGSEELVFSIKDNGIGIAVEDQSKVFEKFKQAGNTMTDKPKGTGLGLPICRQIVEHHGGRLWLESALGVGSTFFFSVPVPKPVTEAEQAAATSIGHLFRQIRAQVENRGPEKTSNPAECTIMVVDDDPHVRQLLRRELETQNYRVMEARDGIDVVTQVKKVKPDLIILDVMMPGMGGYDAAAVLRNDPDTMAIPIIVLSIMEDHQRGYRLGIDRYLKKPIDTEALMREIGQLLTRGTNRRKVVILDEDSPTLKTLSEVLMAQGYAISEVKTQEELMKLATEIKPDMILANARLSEGQHMVKTLRFEKGLENVLVYFFE